MLPVQAVPAAGGGVQQQKQEGLIGPRATIASRNASAYAMWLGECGALHKGIFAMSAASTEEPAAATETAFAAFPIHLLFGKGAAVSGTVQGHYSHWSASPQGSSVPPAA